jgi:tripartite-type tricarboxylate transporter receptor subunit TctC
MSRVGTLVICLLAMLGTPGTWAPARAQSGQPPWPQRTVKLIVPLGPGSGVDATGRLLAGKLQKRWGQPVVIENRPGGDGIPAISAFVDANDDHVLLYAPTGNFTVHPYRRANLPYDPRLDLLPIARVTNTVLAIGVPASTDVATLADLVAHAQVEPGRLNAVVMPGIIELVFDGFVRGAGLNIVKLPYRDVAQAATDLGQNRIQVMMAPLASLRPHVEANLVRLVAVNGRERTALAPAVPTAAEAGYRALQLEGLIGLFGPRGMRLELRERIAADVMATIDDPDIAAQLIGSAQVVNPGGPAALEAAMLEQMEQVARIAQALGMQPK